MENQIGYGKKLVTLSREALRVIFIYSLAIAILSLVIPISVQTLINVVSFGTLLQPIIVLSIVLLVVLAIIASIRVAQSIVVESIQQHLFTKLGLEIADFLPKIKMSHYESHRANELVNHFFEIQTIQKALATLLITGIEIVLVAIFSMILIAFYHPLLLLFDVVLVAAIFLSLWLPWRNALQYSIKECAAKHDVAAWLQDIVRNIFLFKMQSHGQYALAVIDDKISHYLRARKKHFASIIRHIASMNAIYVLGNAVLLGIGGYLVIREQLTLGQLVASELIINALLYSVVRFSYYMEDLYDLMASCAKITTLLNVPKETEPSFNEQQLSTYETPPAFTASGITFIANDQRVVFKDLAFTISSNEKVCVIGDKNSGKSTLIDLLLGFAPCNNGTLKINNIPIKDYAVLQLRNHASLVRHVELFSGTVYENIVMQRKDISTDDVYWLLEKFKLNKMIEAFPEGLATQITGTHVTKPTVALIKLALIRAVITKPTLLIVDGLLDRLAQDDQKRFLDYFIDYSGTVILTTQSQYVANHFDKIIKL